MDPFWYPMPKKNLLLACSDIGMDMKIMISFLENKHDGPCQSNDISFFLRRINTLASKALVALLNSDTSQCVNFFLLKIAYLFYWESQSKTSNFWCLHFRFLHFENVRVNQHIHWLLRGMASQTKKKPHPYLLLLILLIDG